MILLNGEGDLVICTGNKMCYYVKCTLVIDTVIYFETRVVPRYNIFTISR